MTIHVAGTSESGDRLLHERGESFEECNPHCVCPHLSEVRRIATKTPGWDFRRDIRDERFLDEQVATRPVTVLHNRMEKVADASLIEAIIRKNTCQNRIEAGVFQKGQKMNASPNTVWILSSTYN